jgi:predicted mannosyl-3-phosphoglycerate phosphatase (HAD superfamily)
LHHENLRATRSGNWIAITQGADKGTGARAVLARARRGGAPFMWTAAIGNAANDVPLLAASEGALPSGIREAHHAELLDLPDVKPLSSSGRVPGARRSR